jgi:hypothetical protein
VEVIALSDGRLLSKDWDGRCLLWSPFEEGQRGGSGKESVSAEEYNRLREGALSSNAGAVVGQVAPGYSVVQNCVQGELCGRVFVDEAVQWVVKSGDVIAVFEGNGRDHWFKEVSG